MIIVTTNTVPGKEIKELKGLVKGIAFNRNILEKIFLRD